MSIPLLLSPLLSGLDLIMIFGLCENSLKEGNASFGELLDLENRIDEIRQCDVLWIVVDSLIGRVTIRSGCTLKVPILRSYLLSQLVAQISAQSQDWCQLLSDTCFFTSDLKRRHVLTLSFSMLCSHVHPSGS